MVCVVSLSFSRLSSPCDVARFGIKLTITVTDLWKNVLNIVSFFNEAADTISKSNVQKPDFSFQFFEWVSIKSRSTYVYNIYINIETGWIGNMSNRICIKSRWQFWMQLYSNCNLITWSITTTNIFHFVWGSNLVKVCIYCCNSEIVSCYVYLKMML